MACKVHLPECLCHPTLTIALAVLFLGVLGLGLGQAAGAEILTDRSPDGSLFFFPYQHCYTRCLCPLLPLLSLPTSHPTWASLGLLIVDASGVLKQVVCRSPLHCDVCATSVAAGRAALRRLLVLWGLPWFIPALIHQSWSQTHWFLGLPGGTGSSGTCC